MPTFALLLALLFALSPVDGIAQIPVHRDWAAYPAVVQIDTGGDIYAIGDVHGDSDRLIKLLTGAKIIEAIDAHTLLSAAPVAPAVNWIAGNAVLVFLGDMIDKGPHPLGTIQFIRRLRDSAMKSGGQVVILMGNHEAAFLANPDTDKTKDFTADLNRSGWNVKDAAACRGDLGEFLCRLPLAARVGDWFFSHGGNSGGRTMARLISDLQTGIERDGFGTLQLTDSNSLLEARLGDQGPGGKSWFETESPKRSAEQLLGDYAAALGVAHIVEGHQHQRIRFLDGTVRQAGQMLQRYGRIFLIDTGMSRGIGDSGGAVLHIRRQGPPQADAICPSGKTTIIWNLRGKARFGRARACAVKD